MKANPDGTSRDGNYTDEDKAAHYASYGEELPDLPCECGAKNCDGSCP
ncbi:hypothetical protein SAMN04489729_4798 [Amycolatopsis lurida]|nr:hypothetical protein SAMN04489729_4798 [Amycolatopsis lurida]